MTRERCLRCPCPVRRHSPIGCLTAGCRCARQYDGSGITPLRVLAAAVAVLALASLGGCSNAAGARQALQAQGFTSIQTTGWAMFGCSEDDSTCTGFKATGATGAKVRGVVGCGRFFKGCTVRITGVGQ